MVSGNRSILPLEQQPDPTGPYGQVSGLSKDALLSLRHAERMSIVSKGVLNAAREGEPYETLVRMVSTLHEDLASLTTSANRALREHGFYRQSE